MNCCWITAFVTDVAMTNHTTKRKAKLRPLPAHGLVEGGALPPLVPYHARYMVEVLA